MSNGILVFFEHRGGVFSKHSFEAIAAAQDLASQLQQPVNAVVLGSDNTALAQEVWHMHSKLHAVYGVWIVQREGLR